MSDYKEIKGKTVQFIATDPSDTGAEGQVWYNSTDGAFKSVVVGEAWSSGAPLGSARYDAGGAGIQTAGLMFGGRSPAIPSTTLTEEYNGSGWATGGSLNLGRQQVFSFGSQTAAVGASGYKDAGGPGFRTETEEYNGTSWTTGNTCPIASFAGAGFGIETAGVVCGGRTPAPTNATAEYDGTTWTAVNNMTASLQQLSGVGTLTAGATFGGHNGTGIVDTIQEYDGTNWSDAGNLPAARSMAGTSGIQTASIVYGGLETAVVNTTLSYDGTTISSNPATMATARRSFGFPSGAPASTNTEAFAAGGYSTATVGVTEEYSKSINVVTGAAWSSGGNLSTNRQEGGGFGIQTSAAVVGGEVNPGYTNNTEEYNGSSWTAGGNYPASLYKIGTSGTLTAGLGFCGGNPYGTTTVNEYDGSTWTAGGSYPVAYSDVRGAGTQTATIAAAGDAYPTSPRYSNASYEYDGSTWTAGGNLGSGRYSTMAAGLQTAAAINGGTPVPSVGTSTEEYDGSTWTAGGTGLIGQGYGGSSNAGTQDNWITFAVNSPNYAFVQGYDGTNWSTRPSLTTGRYGGTGAGTASSALAIGGREPGFSVKTEEFTGETTSLNIKTLTTS